MLQFIPLGNKTIQELGELSRHSGHDMLSNFKSRPQLVAGITCPDNVILANGIIVSPKTKDKQNAVGLARNNWSECPYVGKLAEMLATKLSDYKMIPIDEYSLDNLTPQKRAQINEQLRTQQLQLLDFNNSLDADESRVSN